PGRRRELGGPATAGLAPPRRAVAGGAGARGARGRGPHPRRRGAGGRRRADRPGGRAAAGGGGGDPGPAAGRGGTPHAALPPRAASAGALAADGIAEWTGVGAVPAGGLLAVGTDQRDDRVDGDAAVFRSLDGQSWQRVDATGLTGPGPQEVRRVVVAGDQLIA